MKGSGFFHYQTGSSVLHRAPPAPKTVAMVILAALAFWVPPAVAAALWAALFCAGLCTKLRARDMLEDQKPLAFYAVLMWCAGFCVRLSAFCRSNTSVSLLDIARLLAPDGSYLPFLAQLGCSLSVTSLFFRTTSTVQLHEGCAAIERAVTRKKTTPLADTLSLTLTFIPRLAAQWRQLETAWRARGGKASVRRILVLVPALFSLGMHEAWQKALSRENRAAQDDLA